VNTGTGWWNRARKQADRTHGILSPPGLGKKLKGKYTAEMFSLAFFLFYAGKLKKKGFCIFFLKKGKIFHLNLAL